MGHADVLHHLGERGVVGHRFGSDLQRLRAATNPARDLASNGVLEVLGVYEVFKHVILPGLDLGGVERLFAAGVCVPFAEEGLGSFLQDLVSLCYRSSVKGNNTAYTCAIDLRHVADFLLRGVVWCCVVVLGVGGLASWNLGQSWLWNLGVWDL